MNSARAATISAVLTFVATLSTFIPNSGLIIVGAFLSIPAFVMALIGWRSRRRKLALLNVPVVVKPVNHWREASGGNQFHAQLPI